jgi:hypothetical protein
VGLNRNDLRDAAAALVENDIYLLLRHRGHFLSPLVPREWALLAHELLVADDGVRRVADEILPAALPHLCRGIYFPVPIAHALERGEDRRAALARFHYEMIHVDADQVWRWQGREVAPRVKAFFLEHLRYEPALDIYCFEYRVSKQSWDKSYLDAEVTPMLGLQIAEQEGGRIGVQLNNGQADLLDPTTFRLDDRERLFCRTQHHGEVQLSGNVRFALLKTISEDCDSLRIGAAWYPLRWPDP